MSDTTDDIPTPSDPTVALAMERMRRVVEVGFERQSGSLALLVQRYDQTAATLDDHDSRLDALEANRWPVKQIMAVIAAIGLLITVWQVATAGK